jgi:hypothetical protein
VVDKRKDVSMEQWKQVPENATEPMQKAMQIAVMLRKSMNDVWRAGLAEVADPPPAVAKGWQPIETAPKDGTVVLLAGCRKPVAAAWLEDEIDWWHVDDNKRGPFALRGPGPTHWMPLPAPPLSA